MRSKNSESFNEQKQDSMIKLGLTGEWALSRYHIHHIQISDIQTQPKQTKSLDDSYKI